MRIVQVSPDYVTTPPQAYGGIEKVVYDLTEQLVQLGHEVFLYALDGSRSRAKLMTYPHKSHDDQKMAEFIMRTLPERIDLIHDHTHDSVIGRLKGPIPIVCTIHVPTGLHNPVDHPVYLSELMLQRSNRSDGYYVYNGLRQMDYEFSREKKDYLLFLGRIDKEKGVHHALEIAEKTKRKTIIAGPIWDEAYYRNHIAPWMRRLHNVEYVGEVAGQQKQDLLKHAACLVYPTVCEEQFGLAMVEAMACGTPVVALRNGSVPEVLKGMPHLICRSVEEMTAKVMDGPFPDPVCLRDYVSARFTREIMTDRYLRIYQKVLNSE